MTHRKARKQQRHESTGLLLIGLVIAVMLGFGIFYQVDLVPKEPIAQPETVNSEVNLACQEKLLAYIKQGGVDLHAEMSYGSLQGCNFSSESELREQRLNANRGSWSAVLK